MRRAPAYIVLKSADEILDRIFVEEDFTNGETLCLLGTIDMKRDGGKSKFQLQPDSLFDASLADIMWQVDTNADFRIVQFRVYATGS